MLTGAVHATDAWAGPAVAVTGWGAPGTVRGVAITGDDDAPEPATFAAITVKVYEVPSLSPETVQVSAPLVVQLPPPGLALTTYPVMVAPPSLDGAFHDTVTAPGLGVAVTVSGAPGTVRALATMGDEDAPATPPEDLASTVMV